MTKKKVTNKKSMNNKCNKNCKTKASKDCPDGICPIKKPKKKSATIQKVPVETVAPEVPKVSMCSKILSVLKFWK